MKLSNNLKLIVLFLCAALALAGCSLFAGIINRKTTSESSAPTEQTVIDLDTRIKNSLRTRDKILIGINDYMEEIALEGVDSDEAMDTYFQILDECPDLFWISGSCETTEYSVEDGVTTVLKIKYLDSVEEIRRKKQIYYDTIYEVLEAARACESNFDKALFIHDWLVDECKFDSDTLNKTNENAYSYTAYGCIVNKTGVCASYAKAFQTFMNLLGYDCLYVPGKGNSDSFSDGHAWNVLRIDSEYYQVDVTWDDPMMADGSDSKRYDYFCVTTEEIKRDHIFDDEDKFPICTANKDNYFVHEGLYIEKYSFDEYKRVFSEKQTDGEMFAVRFSSKEELDRAVSDLFDENAIFDISYYSDKTVEYSVGEEVNSLYIFAD